MQILRAINLLFLVGSMMAVSALDLNSCKSKAVMCCWSKKLDKKTGKIGPMPKSNTDVCSVKGSIKGYFGVEEGNVHRHGFAWSNNPLNDKFKDELLTYVNVTDHFTKRGYSAGVAGQPDCNCLGEDDAVIVSRADCTEVAGVGADNKPTFKACTAEFPNNLRFYLKKIDPQSKILVNETNLIKTCTKIHPNPVDVKKFDLDSCTSRVVTCCWDKALAQNGTYYAAANNTDICSVNGKTEGYEGKDEGPIHCHSFSWTNSSYNLNAQHKTELLEFLYMSHFRNKGFYGNLKGAPMCGCMGAPGFKLQLSASGCSTVHSAKNGTPIMGDCKPVGLRAYLLKTDPSNPLLEDNLKDCSSGGGGGNGDGDKDGGGKGGGKPKCRPKKGKHGKH